MNSWILKELRALVLTDLKEFIPHDYFNSEASAFNLNDTFKNNKYLSFELRWGNLAYELGHKLYFQPPNGLTARQVSASVVLMNLGMLAASEAALNATEQISNKAATSNVHDGNSGNVALQLKKDIIPNFENNISGAVEQYLQYLTNEESRPYIWLLPESTQKEIKYMNENTSKIINNTINVSGSNSGDIQMGESNTYAATKEKKTPLKLAFIAFIKWLTSNIGKVISGLLLVALTAWLGLG